jgi:hypothetical protein
VICPSGSGAYELIVHDLAGKTCRRQVLADSKETLDLSALERGMYLVSIREGDRPVRQFRIVVTGE